MASWTIKDKKKNNNKAETLFTPGWYEGIERGGGGGRVLCGLSET